MTERHGRRTMMKKGDERMKIRFLGTGAADWAGPDERGEYRRLTRTLFDDELLIDLTEGILEMIPQEARIRSVLITHSHGDHYSPAAIGKIGPETVYAHESWAGEIDVPGAEVRALKIGEWTQAGTFEVMAMPSNHSTDRLHEQTVHYLLRKEGKYFLYATDGAWLLNRELKLMQGITLSGAARDATIGDGHEGDYRIFEHNSLPMVRIMTDTMKQTGLLAPEAPVFLTHMARTLHPSQKELEANVGAPLVACFDGMEAEV